MGQYDAAIAVAKRLITKFGATVSVRAVDRSGTDPWDEGAGTATDYPTKGVILDYTSIAAGQMKQAGEAVASGDKWCLIECADLALVGDVTDKHFIVDSTGKVWKILTVKKLAPDGTSKILYDLHLGV